MNHLRNLSLLSGMALVALLLNSCPASSGSAATGNTIPDYLSAKSTAPYSITSTHLKEPEKVFEFMKQAAEFWKGTWDAENGGFYTFVSREGKILDHDVKTTLSQSRTAYAFSRAYMVTGDKSYLDYARKAVDFLRSKSYDQENGGFHTVVNRRGENIDMAVKYDNTRQKASFFQHYALLGPAALADATRSADDLDFLIKCRNILDTKLWDSRPGLEGYFDIADYDWANPRGKGFTPTLDGITTHVLALYLLTGEAKYRERLIALGDEVVDRLVPTLKTRKAGFAENFDNNWIDTGNSFLFIGHVLKAAWCLDRIYLVEPKPAYREASEQLMANVWERLWDHENGGPFMIADSLSGAITNPVKENWTLEQGVTAGLINYYLTENPIALQMADQSMVFYDRFLTDRQYGESLTNVSADGATVLDSNKGAYYKSGYHHMELGYMVYLYGNLFLHKKPVSLYYFLEKETSDRTLVMNPVEIESNRLVIQSVELDGKPWTDFDGVNRVLRVPAGKGGEFRVSYAIAPTEGK